MTPITAHVRVWSEHVSMGERSRLIECPRTVPTCNVLSRPLDSLGDTPLIRVESSSREVGCEILAKAEYLNPSGSIKDRIARYIIEEAEARGELKRGARILEVTSGNTGIALAMVGAMKGYPVEIMMPRTVSRERRAMIESYGARLHLLEKLSSIQSAVARTVELALESAEIFLPSQFSNPDNPRCHEKTTGPEILRQTGGSLDSFVMGVGTGGTLMGVGRALRSAGINALVVAVEPDESAVMSGDRPGSHGIQGLADGFIPQLVALDEVDEIIRVSTVEAMERSARLAREDGLMVGLSAGANIAAAEILARRLGRGKTIVTVLPDRGERYLSLNADGSEPVSDSLWLDG